MESLSLENDAKKAKVFPIVKCLYSFILYKTSQYKTLHTTTCAPTEGGTAQKIAAQYRKDGKLTPKCSLCTSRIGNGRLSMLLIISLDLSNKYDLSFVIYVDRKKLCLFVFVSYESLTF